MPHAALPLVDELLDAHAAALGRDLVAYRNHARRVARFCLALLPEAAARDPVAREKIAIAAVYHDVGIWTAGTFDYLDPSVAAALAHLARTGRSAWAPEIEAMIREHHKITPFRAHPDWLVEPFRRADWIDVSFGLLAFGLPRRVVADARATWPDAGFHRRLAALSLARLRTHPLNPLPMLRL